MKMSVVLKSKLHKKLMYLMNNITSLNNGKEIGAWLLGKWYIEDENMILKLDDMYIYKQSVSTVEVNINEESMLDTIAKLGYEKCNRIKALWHIHPFCIYKPSWSTTDDENIKDFMDIAKGREIFAFLLSSTTQIICRIVINFKGKISTFKKTIVLQEEYNNVDVVIEETSKDKLYKELEEEIKTNVVNQNSFKFDDVDIKQLPLINKDKERIDYWFNKSNGFDKKKSKIDETDDEIIMSHYYDELFR